MPRSLAPWELHYATYPGGKFAFTPFIYAPRAPEARRHVCQLELDAATGTDVAETVKANGDLIAAAPDLLAICQEIAAAKIDLLTSERRARLYGAIRKAGGEL